MGFVNVGNRSAAATGLLPPSSLRPSCPRSHCLSLCLCLCFCLSCFLNATLQALLHTPMLANYLLSRQHSARCSIGRSKPPAAQPRAPHPSAGFLSFSSAYWSQPWQTGCPTPSPSAAVSPPFCLCCSLESVVGQSFSSPRPFAPHAIVDRLPAISRSLRRGRQEDAHEFLRLAFDVLQSNVLSCELPAAAAAAGSRSASPSASALSPAPRLPLPKGSSIPAALYASLQADQLHRVKETSVLYAIYAGYYRSTLTCRACSQPSHTFEPFLDLSLPIPAAAQQQQQQQHSLSLPLSLSQSLQPFSPFSQRVLGFSSRVAAASLPRPPPPPSAAAQPVLTLHDCLRSFTSEEQLDSDNLYRCSACRRRSRASKRIAIHQAPNVLVIHLKRFEQSAAGGAAGWAGGAGLKVSRMVRYELTLDLSPYLTRERERREAEDAGCCLYELYAVVVHAGGSVQSGHYFSFVKAADGGWYEMDDSQGQAPRPRSACCSSEPTCSSTAGLHRTPSSAPTATAAASRPQR